MNDPRYTTKLLKLILMLQCKCGFVFGKLQTTRSKIVNQGIINVLINQSNPNLKQESKDEEFDYDFADFEFLNAE